MAEISSFHAYRYNLQRVQLTDVVTQPYDKITPAMQQTYLSKSPDNLIRVEKGTVEPNDCSTNNVYTRAETVLAEWIRQGILLRDPAAGIYAYFQEYTIPGTSTRRVRKGFIALGQIEDYDAGVIFRHEQTLAGPKADRLNLLRSTRTHTGQLFMLYADPKQRVDEILEEQSRSSAPMEARDEYNIVHRVWPIFDANTIAEIVRQMADKNLVIADGHHRYETALTYRNERRSSGGGRDAHAPYEKAMMTFFNSNGENLLILPTHRIVANLAGFSPVEFRSKIAAIFDHRSYSFGSDAARAAAYQKFQTELAARGTENPAIGMYSPGVFDIFELRHNVDLAALLPQVSPAQRRLDVVLLHRLLLENILGITPAAVSTEKNITYERDMNLAIATVDDGKAQVCFLLNPIGVERVVEIALAGEVLPQKSTDFYPKLLSGLTLYRME